MLEKALSGYDAQKEAKDAKAAKEPSKVSKTKKSRLAPDPHPPPEVCTSSRLTRLNVSPDTSTYHKLAFSEGLKDFSI